MSRSEIQNAVYIHDGVLVTQNSKREVIAADLIIQNGTIQKIIKRPSRFSAPKNIKKINAKGLYILPGFVQAHVHLCQTLFRNHADDLELLDWLKKKIWVMEAAHTEETLYNSASLGIYELLSSGTTCILDMGTVRHTEAIIQAAIDLGIRASIGKCLMDHPSTCPDGLRESTRDALSEAVNLFKMYHETENDRIRVSYAPRFVISCTEKLLTEVKKLAQTHGALIHTHASENLKEIQFVKELVGCENIEYLHQLGLTSKKLVLAHCIWLKPNEKEILKKTGTHVVHCPSSNMKLASGFAHVADLLKRGINVSLGADGAPCNNNLNMLTEMRFAALIHKPANGPKSMPAEVVLDMATRDGAKALGWFDKIGSIEIGKKADLTCFDFNLPENFILEAYGRLQIPSIKSIASSLVYSTQKDALHWTMVDGKIVFDQKTKLAFLSRSQLIKNAVSSQESIQRLIENSK